MVSSISDLVSKQWKQGLSENLKMYLPTLRGPCWRWYRIPNSGHLPSVFHIFQSNWTKGPCNLQLGTIAPSLGSDAHWLQWLLLSPLYSLIIDQLFYVFQIFVEISPMDPPKQCNENLPPLPYHLAFWSCTDLVKFEIHVQRSDTSNYPNSTKFYLFLPTVKLDMHVQYREANQTSKQC